MAVRVHLLPSLSQNLIRNTIGFIIRSHAPKSLLSQVTHLWSAKQWCRFWVAIPQQHRCNYRSLILFTFVRLFILSLSPSHFLSLSLFALIYSYSSLSHRLSMTTLGKASSTVWLCASDRFTCRLKYIFFSIHFSVYVYVKLIYSSSFFLLLLRTDWLNKPTAQHCNCVSEE